MYDRPPGLSPEAAHALYVGQALSPANSLWSNAVPRHRRPMYDRPPGVSPSGLSPSVLWPSPRHLAFHYDSFLDEIRVELQAHARPRKYGARSRHS